MNGAQILIATLAVLVALSGCRGCGESAPSPAGSEGAPTPTAAAASAQLVIWGDADPDSGDAPLAVELSADPLEDIDQPTYTWDFGDGSPPSNEQNPKHTYQNPGHFTAHVRVTDAAGHVGEDEVDIDVDQPGPAPPPAAQG